MTTTKKSLQKLAKEYDVRLSEQREQGKRVFGLHGFLSDIEAMERHITGYYIEEADTGHYLYSERATWK